MKEESSIFANDSPQFQNIVSKLKKVLVKKQVLKNAQPSHIKDTNILIGNYTHSTNLGLLEKNSVKLVVSCVNIENKQREQCERKGIRYEFILFKDHKDSDICEQVYKLKQVLSKTQYKNVVKSLQQRILINCFSGRSRSIGLTIGFLMLFRQLSYHQALFRVGQTCNISYINSGFQWQLKKFEQILGQNRQTNAINMFQNDETNIKQAQQPIQNFNQQKRKESLANQKETQTNQVKQKDSNQQLLKVDDQKQKIQIYNEDQQIVKHQQVHQNQRADKQQQIGQKQDSKQDEKLQKKQKNQSDQKRQSIDSNKQSNEEYKKIQQETHQESEQVSEIYQQEQIQSVKSEKAAKKKNKKKKNKR